ncbi:MAG: DUF1688 family protein [Myxococcales bacterium]|nr:DUF1688 family protein [Myxococcales bacterium]
MQLENAFESDRRGALTGVEHVEGTLRDAVVLRAPSTIRARARLLFERAAEGRSSHFRVDPSRLDEVAQRVAEHAPSRPCRLIHGRMRHFDCGKRARTREIASALALLSARDRARAWVDAVVPSVFLDAGAGPTWAYEEGGTRYTRSEGIAVASLAMFREGKLSGDRTPMVCDAAGLLALTARSLAEAFQVSADNPLVGLEGRLALMHALGRALAARGGPDARPALLFDLANAAAVNGRIDAQNVLALVLGELGEIWPPHLLVAGVNVGDVWRHPALGTGVDGLLPFHKLSQWLTYSLVEPFLEGGLELRSLDQLTPLAEYRNGGLLIDMGVISLEDPDLARGRHEIGDPLIVEWRALTVSLLDELRPLLRARLGQEESAGALEAATWSAGRAVARERRPDGGSPLSIASDGTVF